MSAVPRGVAVTPLVIGVTSHRDLCPDEIEPVRQRVRAFFAHLQGDYPQLPLVVLSALADGGDQWVAAEALTAGARLVAPLPLPPALYTRDFGSDARARFDDLCQQAHVFELPLLAGSNASDIASHGPARDRQYAQAGVFVASHCHILLALWDGRPSDLLGGTAQIVRYHLEGVVPGWIDRRRSHQVVLESGDESLLFHIPCSRLRDDGTAQPPLEPLQPLQARWISQLHVLPAQAGMPQEFRRMFVRMCQFNQDAERYADAIAGEPATPTHGATGVDENNPPAGLFAVADWLAIHFQRQVLRAMRGTYVLAALMGIAFVCYSDLPTQLPWHENAIYVFIVLFAAGVWLAWLAHRRDWHRKYIDYRALAEGLRVQRFWRRAGIDVTGSSAFAHDNFMQKQDIELGWIRNAMRAAALRAPVHGASRDGQLTDVIAQWIGAPGHGGQLAYYARKAGQRSHLHRITKLIGRACLWSGIAISVLLAIFHRGLGAELTTSLVAVMGALAIIAAARESYAYRKADKELIKQYSYMRDIFGNARKQLDQHPMPDRQRDILRALGEAALAEHAEWALMHRERPLEHGKL